MAEQTLKLLASAYSTNNATVTNASNAYTDVSSSTSATMVVSSTGNGQVYFSGFDFSQIPVSATINSVTYKIRAKTTSANTYVYVCLGNKSTGTELSAEQQLTTSETTYTCTPTSATWSDIVALGSNFAFRVNSRQASSRTVYVYGMEIDVTYTVPTVPNKVIYNGNTLIDLTGDDVTAADVALGKLFHLANGEQAVGTGGGLEYETGTYSPSSNTTTAPTISFSKTHTDPPAFIAMSKTGTGSNAQNAYLRYSWVDMSRAIAEWGKPSSGTWYRSYEFLTYANTSTSETNYTTTHTNDITRINGSSFEPYNGNSKTFRSTYVYNWIAVWV